MGQAEIVDIAMEAYIMGRATCSPICNVGAQDLVAASFFSQIRCIADG